MKNTWKVDGLVFLMPPQERQGFTPKSLLSDIQTTKWAKHFLLQTKTAA